MVSGPVLARLESLVDSYSIQSSREIVNPKVKAIFRTFFYFKTQTTTTKDFCKPKFDKILLLSGLLFPDSTVHVSYTKQKRSKLKLTFLENPNFLTCGKIWLRSKCRYNSISSVLS